MQRHPSWNKPAPNQVTGLSRLRKEYDADFNIKRLELIEKDVDAVERYWVKFQGKLVYFSVDYESAAAVYDKLEQENF